MIDRLVKLCFENPKLFWTIIAVGGIGDLIFAHWYLYKGRRIDGAKFRCIPANGRDSIISFLAILIGLICPFWKNRF
jgi:hypothetical protein